MYSCNVNFQISPYNFYPQNIINLGPSDLEVHRGTQHKSHSEKCASVSQPAYKRLYPYKPSQITLTEIKTINLQNSRSHDPERTELNSL